MYSLKTNSSFDSAHFLAGYEGKCRNLHGHRWTVEVEVGGEKLMQDGQTRGMVVDFGDLKKEINLLASDMEKQDAAEFYSELADWAYANGEAMLTEDEPEMQDYENQ